MASKVSILMFLIITSPWLASFQDENRDQLKVMSEGISAKMLERINGINCPPLGLTNRFNVTVLGTEWSRTGGCSYIQRYPSVSPSQLFHLWLRRSQDSGVGHCGDMQNMDHLMFECLSKNHLIIGHEFGNGWQYISLYQHTLFEYYERSKQNESTRLAYRCALYKMVNLDEIWMAISGEMNANQHMKCDGLLEKLKYGPYVNGVQRQWSDGSMLLLLKREDIEHSRRKRSALQAAAAGYNHRDHTTHNGTI